MKARESGGVGTPAKIFSAKVLFLGPRGSGKTWLQEKIIGKQPFSLLQEEMLQKEVIGEQPFSSQETKRIEVRSALFNKTPSNLHSDQLSLDFWESEDPAICCLRTHLVVFVVDSTRTLEEQKEYLNYLKHTVIRWLPCDVLSVIVANKTPDLSKSRRLREVDLLTIKEMLGVDDLDAEFDSVIWVSAETAAGVDKLKKCIIGKLSKHFKSKNEPKTAREMLEEKNLEEKTLGKGEQIRFFFTEARHQLSGASKVMETPLTVKSGIKFKRHLKQAEKNILRDFRRGKITADAAIDLAENIWSLAVQVGKCEVKPECIEKFHESVEEHMGKSLVAAQIIGGLIGAAIGVLLGAFLGLMIGAGLGPGAALIALWGGGEVAVIGASVGAAIGGAALGYWCSRFPLWRQPLSQMEKAATQLLPFRSQALAQNLDVTP